MAGEFRVDAREQDELNRQQELRLAKLAAQKQAASSWLNDVRVDGKGGNVPAITQGTHRIPSLTERLQLADQQTQRLIQQGVSLRKPSPLKQFVKDPAGSTLAILGKYGEATDAIDKAAGIPFTPVNVYNARQTIIRPLSEVHVALGILGEFLIPDRG